MASAKDRRITYRGTAELRQKLKMEAAQRDIAVQKIIDEALKNYFDPHASSADGAHARASASTTERETATSADRHHRWHELLELILTSGRKKLIRAICANIEAFAIALDVAHEVNQHGGDDYSASDDDARLARLLEKARGAVKRSEGTPAGNRPGEQRNA